MGGDRSLTSIDSFKQMDPSLRKGKEHWFYNCPNLMNMIFEYRELHRRKKQKEEVGCWKNGRSKLEKRKLCLSFVPYLSTLNPLPKIFKERK